MGYSTEFYGKIKITPKPKKDVIDFVNGLANSRRVQIDTSKLPACDNIKKTWGVEGEFFCSPNQREIATKIFNKKFTIEKLKEIATQHKISIPIEKMKKDDLIKYFIDGYFWKNTKPNYVIDVNKHPSTQPSLWLHWVINEDGYLEWNGGEKFYEYCEWLKYLIVNIFEPFKYTLNGEIEFKGEYRSDSGIIKVENNKVEKKYCQTKVLDRFEGDDSEDDSDNY